MNSVPALEEKCAPTRGAHLSVAAAWSRPPHLPRGCPACVKVGGRALPGREGVAKAIVPAQHPPSHRLFLQFFGLTNAC